MKKMYSTHNPKMPLCSTYFQRSITRRTDAKSGFVGKSVEYVEVDPSTRYDGMKASDFALENILETGAYDLLKNVSYSQSNLDMAESLENGAAMMNDILDAAENNNANNTEE